ARPVWRRCPRYRPGPDGPRWASPRRERWARSEPRPTPFRPWPAAPRSPKSCRIRQVCACCSSGPRGPMPTWQRFCASAARPSRRSPRTRRSKVRTSRPQTCMPRWRSRASRRSCSPPAPRCADSSHWAVRPRCPRSPSGGARPTSRARRDSRWLPKPLSLAPGSWLMRWRERFQSRWVEMRELVSRTAVTTPGAERPRRLRANPALRALVRETRVDPSQLIAPMFVINGHDHRHEIASLQGHFRLTPDLALREASRLADLGIGGVLLFGIPESKDAEGSGADDPRGPVAETLRGLRREGLPLALVADVCLCEYTSHGHCGVLDGEKVDNDRSLSRLAAAAIVYAEAGADLVGPSAMMDGQVAALRSGLDGAGLVDTAILAYSSKQASSLYEPFREAAGSTPSFGDRK